MAQGPTYRVKFRRRREGKTNYYRRRRLLVSRRPRLVVRKTNRRVIVQIVNAKIIGDFTKSAADSRELAAYGWKGGTCNLPSAYLTGLLAGLRAKANGVDNAILDIGLHPPVKGSKIYAALKGAVDAGLDIPHGDGVFPDEDRLVGEHIVSSFKHLQDEKESTMFSEIGKKKTNITTLPKQFESVKKELEGLTKSQLKKPKKVEVTVPEKTKKKREKLEEKPPRAKPRKPKPKKLIAKGKGKRRKK
ncbi:MAG: 50S ribosomal protein L18 [Candidatus Thorarchaeota archaeon]|nr:MAG: 50S ribosomal protein L18 [Candidatus Thorarchaeota archaeon]